jgi:hypothetical protein
VLFRSYTILINLPFELSFLLKGNPQSKDFKKRQDRAEKAQVADYKGTTWWSHTAKLESWL